MVRKYDGKDLARVLIYFGLIGEVTTSTFNIVCPFHSDINPSMLINLDEGNFFCFGCRASGNAYDFVKCVYPELNELQVLAVLEKILHSKEIQKLNIKVRKKRRIKGNQALNEAKDYYYGLRITDWRNTTTKEEHEVLNYMKQRGFDEKSLNISQCKVSYNVAYPILFPILDNGVFRGWVARTTNKYVEKHRMKYLYNEGFHKRDTLCGNYQEGKVVFVCEGFMDYLSIRTRGHVRNVVALLGWHISDEQVEKLKQKQITTVVCALDNPEVDESGAKGIAYLGKFFEVIPFPYPKEKKDPGEMSETEMRTAVQKVKQVLKQRKGKHENKN